MARSAARCAPVATLVALLAAAGPARAAVSEQVVDLPTRPGVTLRALVVRPEQPRAALILLPGGDGWIGLQPDGRFEEQGTTHANFLLRAYPLLVHRGLLVAVADVPSDRREAPRLNGFRGRPEYAADLQVLIAWLRREAGLPVWLAGSSSGTLSAAVVAARLGPGDGPDGVVLASSLVGSTPDAKGLADMAVVRQLRVPALLVHHRQDACPRCRPDAVPGLLAALSASPRKELAWIEGGRSTGAPCEAQSFHGFAGLESTVAGLIADWVLGAGR